MIELLRSRRSIRKYKDRPIEPAKVEILKEALLRSPSSRGLDPWEFVFVDDQELLSRLARCKPHGAAFLQEAALGIVICGDSDKSDTWIEDCSIASILVQMVAQSLGHLQSVLDVRRRTIGRASEVQSIQQRPEFLPVFGLVDHVKTRSQQWDPFLRQRAG